jgi:hypothetical protein
MSDICKKTFELQKDEFLEGSSTIEELGEEYDMESDFSGYVLILDPDHTEYDHRVSKLETDFEMTSVGYCDTKCGFIEEKGEVGRIGMFNSDISIDEIENILGDVLFDSHKVK